MNEKRLYELTRSVGFLWKCSLGMLVTIALIGTIAWALKPEGESVSYDDLFILADDGAFEIAVNTEKYADVLKASLLQNTPFEEKLYALKYLLSINDHAPESLPPPASDLPRLSEQEYRVLTAFGQALRNPASEEGDATPKPLLELTQLAPPPPFAHYALALFYATHSKTEQAIEAAEAEIEAHPSAAGRELLIDLYSKNRMYQPIRDLQSDPDFAPHIDSYLKRDIALETMDWPVLIRTLLPVAYEGTSLAALFLALVAGVAWATLLLRFSGTLRWSSPAVRLAIPALLLGALSAHLTILAIYLQEDQLGLTRGDTLGSQAIYCIAGIGLREEFLKLLCFAPLIPFLTKRGDELEILVVASLVGLGFAIEENIAYFENSQGVAAIGRFITANFLHLSLTGLCGLALCRAILHGGSAINAAVSTFGIAVLAHGGYDAFIIVPELSEYSFVTFIIFILMSYQFFIWLRHLRTHWNDPISLTAQFTLGLILVLGASYVLLAWNLGPVEAFMSLGEEVVGLAILLVMFYREIPEHVS